MESLSQLDVVNPEPVNGTATEHKLNKFSFSRCVRIKYDEPLSQG